MDSTMLNDIESIKLLKGLNILLGDPIVQVQKTAATNIGRVIIHLKQQNESAVTPEIKIN